MPVSGLHRQIAALRERFAVWPWGAGASGRQLQAGNAAGHSPGRSGREPDEDDPDPAGPQQRPGQDRDAEADRDDPQAEPKPHRPARLLTVNHHARINVLLPDGPAHRN